MKLEFHPNALQEYEEAARYYADQQPGLDERFTDCVESAIRAILHDPSHWRIFDGDTRRCLTRVFPYAILFVVETDFVLIIAVAHCSRAPDYWKERLM